MQLGRRTRRRSCATATISTGPSRRATRAWCTARATRVSADGPAVKLQSEPLEMHGLHALVGMHHAGHSLPRDADSGKPNLSKSVQQDAGGARLMAGRSSRQEMHVGDDRGG